MLRAPLAWIAVDGWSWPGTQGCVPAYCATEDTGRGSIGRERDDLWHGYGLLLQADNLRRVDETEAPAYWEASNVANIPLYERFGFKVCGSFRPPGGPEVVTMWRDPATTR